MSKKNKKESKADFLLEIEDMLKKTLKKSRYRHTLGVAHTSACLAMRYGESMDNAYIAGLLHDVARRYESDEMVSAAKALGVKVSDYDKKNPLILHGRVGAALAKQELLIENQDILNAISNHTTGREDMSLLEKIVYIADYIEPGRNQVSNLNEVRALAFSDIDKCLLQIMSDTLDYLKGNNRFIDELTQKAYDYYSERI